MPALDDYMDELFNTYFYHVTTPQKWEEIKKSVIDPLLLELVTERKQS